MIFLRTSGGDEGVAASTFVSIPQPIGVRDGDLVIAAICLPIANVTVTPPDGDWTKVVQTDPSRTGSVVVFYRTAMNEPPRWVFALSASTWANGGVLVYGGADGFEPVGAIATDQGYGGNYHLPALTTADDGEEVALFVGGAAPSLLTSVAGYEIVLAEAGDGSMSIGHRQLNAAGALAPMTIGSGGNVGGVVLLSLRPSAGTLSVDDVRERIIAAFPRGVEDVYDLTPGGDYYLYFQAMAAWMKAFAFDLVDLLRREIVPQFSRYKLPSWELIFGLETTRITKAGTIPQRQAQVVGGWRAAAGQGSSIPAVQGVLAPLFGYAPGTSVEVIECERSALTLLHSYDLCGGVDDVAIPHGDTTTLSVAVNDGGAVAKMGAHLTLVFASAPLTDYTFVLTAPDGTEATWSGSWKNVPLVLRSRTFAGAKIRGDWTLAITNASGSDNTLYTMSSLFVEGIAPGQETAGAIFDWGAYLDPAHAGENGVNANLVEARRAIEKMTFSHCVGNLIQSKDPWPDTDGGEHAAIPDECIPT